MSEIWEPYRYLERTPGKGLRVKHIEAFNAILQAPAPIVEKIKAIVERFHNVSLLLDDIEDGASLRRGRPVAHSVFGVPQTINTASFVMLETLRQACIDFPECQSILFDELISLHKGQALDLFWRDSHFCPSEEQYNKMVLLKTGGLYRLAVKLLQRYSSTQLDLVEIADLFGLIYQIQDDLLNLSSERYAKNKGFAEDITEGKYSFPVIHLIKQSNKRSLSIELEGILRQHTHDVDLKEHAVHCLVAGGSIEYTQRAIERHYKEALSKIEQLKDPKPLKVLLDQLVVVLFRDE